MNTIYLSLGSNLGNRDNNITIALNEIEKNIGHIIKVSSQYETAPWGFTSTNNFINIAVEIETDLTPYQLLEQTQKIETNLGRSKKRGDKYEDRTIDIDILLYNNIIIEEENLTIPHPKMQQRTFVIEPLAEIAPQLYHPISCKTIKEIKDELTKV
ncbi:MAG: 2-amino-4-hydroxy-6-hydroxymethyldihydropteridine diphosphokinase [Bacteroidales bacterium]